MKIAIVTFVHAYNYGAELQCFALQYKLRSMGYDAEVLNIFRPSDEEYKHTKAADKKFSQLYKHKSVSDKKAKRHAFIANILDKILKIVYFKKYRDRKNNFDVFHVKFTKLSNESFFNFCDLYNRTWNYSHFVVGSDQVWNYSCPFSIEPYMLTFVTNAKKISYAASIGHSEIPKELHPFYKKHITSFDFVSIREEQGTKIVKQITKREDICTVLDPTLLLTKKEWERIFKLKQSQKKPYILLYLLSRSSYSVELAIDLAKRKDWDIKIITVGVIPQYNYKNITYICGASAAIFVSLFYGASFVITNSFHGTAFSVNFNIPFISTTRNDKRYNSRLENILKIVNLEKRLVYEHTLDFKIGDDLINEDFTSVNVALNKEREKSLNFIVRSLAE